MKNNKYTVFLTYFTGIILIIGLNILFRWTTEQVQNGNHNVMFLIFVVPLLEGTVIGMTAISVYKFQMLFMNKYFLYLSLAVFGAILMLPVHASGFMMLYLGVAVFSALIASLRLDNLARNKKNIKKKKK